MKAEHHQRQWKQFPLPARVLSPSPEPASLARREISVESLQHTGQHPGHWPAPPTVEHFLDYWLKGGGGAQIDVGGAVVMQMDLGCVRKVAEQASKQHASTVFALVPASRTLSWVSALAVLSNGGWMWKRSSDNPFYFSSCCGQCFCQNIHREQTVADWELSVWRSYSCALITFYQRVYSMIFLCLCR